MTLGTFIVDADLVVRTWDDSLAHATGIPADRAVGRRLAEVVPAVASRGLLERFREVLTDGVVHVLSPSLHRYLLPCPPRTPSRRFEHMQQRVTLGPLRDHGGVVGVVVGIEDVTARIEAERDLAESLARGEGDWQARRGALQQYEAAQSPEFGHALIELLRAQHGDLDVVSSVVQLLSGTAADVTPALVELQEHPHADVRIQAALALGRRAHAPEAAVSGLLGALGDRDANVRFQAIESLGRLRAPAAIPALVQVIEEGDEFLSFAALDALTAIGDPGAMPALVRLLDHPRLSAPAAEAIAAAGGSAAVVALLDALNRRPPAPLPLAQALAGIDRRMPRGRGWPRTVPEEVASTLTAGGRTHLLDAARSASVAERSAIARVIGWIDGPEALAVLAAWLDQPETHDEAVAALAGRGEEAVPAFLAELAHDDEQRRREAIAALGAIGSRRATPALIEILEDDRPLAPAAAAALARIADPAAIETLFGRVGDEQALVRHAAIEALLATGVPDLAARLPGLVDSPDARIRESAVRLAAALAGNAGREHLFRLASDPEEPVRAAALEHLPLDDVPRALGLLTHAVAEGTPMVRAASARALGRMRHAQAAAALLAAIGDRDLWVRYFAVRSLAGGAGSEMSDVLLGIARNDAAPPVRIAAIEGVAGINPAASAGTLIALADDGQEDVAEAAVRSLGRVRTPEATATLQRAIREGTPRVRVAAVRALSEDGSTQAITALEWGAAADDEVRVWQAAIDALAALGTAATAAGDAALDALVALLADRERAPQVVDVLSDLPPERLASMERHREHPHLPTRYLLGRVLAGPR